MTESKRITAAWLKEQSARGRRSALPVVGLGLLGVALAIGQAWCAAGILQLALAREAAGAYAAVPLLAGFAGLGLLRAGAGLLAERAAVAAGAAGRRRVRNDAMARLLGAGPAMLRGQHSAELAAAVVDRVEALEGLFARWLPASTLAVAGPALVAIALACVDPLAAAVLVGIGLLVPVAMAASGIGAAMATRRQFLALTRLQARFLDRVRGIATIVLYGRAEQEARALELSAKELRVRTMRVLRVAFLSSTALDCAMAAALIWVAVHYGLAIVGGRMSHPGEALFALLLVPEFFAPLRLFSAAYQDRFGANAAAEVLAGLPPEQPAPAILPVRTVEARGVTVTFDDVRLSWDPARGPALDGLTFRVPPGETLVLVGPSGAGKTTVMEILLGFVRPDSGRVMLNGAEMATIVPAALARMTAWIGQKPMLFAGTLAENIRFAKPEASEAEINEAVRLARLDAVVAQLPLGLETPIGEGGFGLAGGQAQRVAIARAFLKNAPLLLLDEPTAHLDPASEAEVLDSLRRLAAGRTVILASHSAAAHAFPGRRLDIRDGRAVSGQARGAA